MTTTDSTEEYLQGKLALATEELERLEAYLVNLDARIVEALAAETVATQEAKEFAPVRDQAKADARDGGQTSGVDETDPQWRKAHPEAVRVLAQGEVIDEKLRAATRHVIALQGHRQNIRYADLPAKRGAVSAAETAIEQHRRAKQAEEARLAEFKAAHPSLLQRMKATLTR